MTSASGLALGFFGAFAVWLALSITVLLSRRAYRSFKHYRRIQRRLRYQPRAMTTITAATTANPAIKPSSASPIRVISAANPTLWQIR